MLVPGPPDLQQLVLVVFFIPATSANTLPALVVVTLCNLRWWSFPSTTCAYSNLHCGGGGGGSGGGDGGGDGGGMW